MPDSLRRSIGALALVAGTALAAGAAARAPAQTVAAGWSDPVRLSSGVGTTYRGNVVADSAGWFHVLWDEAGFPDRQVRLRYARFDGGTWTDPVDIHVGRPGFRIGPLSLAIDAGDRLHLAWTESDIPHTLGDYWPGRSALVYTSVDAAEASRPERWQPATRVPEEAVWVRLQVAPDGVVHLVNGNAFADPRGLFHRRSTDGGGTWSDPVRIDPPFAPDVYPFEFQFRADDSGRLHVVWEYRNPSDAVAIHYARSTDGGRSWPARTELDRVDANAKEFTYGYPLLAVQGDEVHAIWIGGGPANVGRRYRASGDGGVTWTPRTQVFGDLVSSTGSEGLIADPRGGILWSDQVRYPQGIYVARRRAGQWADPELIYLIASDHTDAIGGRLHAHRIDTAIGKGRQVIVFATEPLPGARVDLYAIVEQDGRPAGS